MFLVPFGTKTNSHIKLFKKWGKWLQIHFWLVPPNPSLSITYIKKIACYVHKKMVCFDFWLSKTEQMFDVKMDRFCTLFYKVLVYYTKVCMFINKYTYNVSRFGIFWNAFSGIFWMRFLCKMRIFKVSRSLLWISNRLLNAL